MSYIFDVVMVFVCFLSLVYAVYVLNLLWVLLLAKSGHSTCALLLVFLIWVSRVSPPRTWTIFLDFVMVCGCFLSLAHALYVFWIFVCGRLFDVSVDLLATMTGSMLCHVS